MLILRVVGVVVLGLMKSLIRCCTPEMGLRVAERSF
jgi:hypothetical protein